MATSWALISGASSGIGRATALQLAAKGFHVLAGVRADSAAANLQSAAASLAGRIVPITLDVTDQSSIDHAARKAGELCGTGGLRVVMNNAGVVIPGPVEFVSAANWRRQFDINFFGMIELTRSTLPLLRQAVVSFGPFVPRLLFISSIVGRVSQPIVAPYTTSKFATTALGDALRIELRRQGIGVTVVEPGAVTTEIWGKANQSAAEFPPTHPAFDLYGPEIQGAIKSSQRMLSKAISAEKAAQSIVRSIMSRKPKARLLVGNDAKILAALHGFLPRAWFEEMLMRDLNIAGLPVAAR